MEMKTCKMCGENKQLSCFYKLKTGKSGVQANCMDCAKVLMSQRYISNRQYYLLKAEEYRRSDAGKESRKKYSKSQKGRDRQINYLKRYRLRDQVRQVRAQHIEMFREKARQNRAMLTSGYVRQVIKTLSSGVLTPCEIPDSLVEAKRHSIFLKRLLKQKKTTK